MLDSFFKFDKLITPTIIKIIYFLGLVLVGVLAVWQLVVAIQLMNIRVGDGLMWFIITLAATPFAVIMWRVYAELLLVMFRIFDKLGEISDKLTKH